MKKFAQDSNVKTKFEPIDETGYIPTSEYSRQWYEKVKDILPLYDKDDIPFQGYMTEEQIKEMDDFFERMGLNK